MSRPRFSEDPPDQVAVMQKGLSPEDRHREVPEKLHIFIKESRLAEEKIDGLDNLFA